MKKLFNNKSTVDGIDDVNLRAKKLLEEKDADMRVREYEGKMALGIVALFVLWAIFQLYASTFGAMDAMTLRAWHILFLLMFTFLVYPTFKSEKKLRKSPPIWDYVLIALTFFAFGYMILNYSTIALRGGYLETMDYVVAAIAILVVFEGARRACPSMAILGLVFLAYNFFGPWIPGEFGHGGFSIKRVLSHMFWGSQGIFGVGIGVSATYIFLFIVFGAFLKYSGFSQFINDMALTLVGQTPGGPAKVAVLASALLGMINGSAIANVATTGTITIPLMKKTGYKAEFAAAVEAVASTGGQFAPPIMGAVGFVMAEFLGVSYTEVLLAACIPAFLYYLTLLFAVHFEAKKLGLSGLSKDNIPNAAAVFWKQGHLMIPLVVLIGMLFMGYTPLFAAVIAIVATVAASWIRKNTRMYPKTIIKATVEGAKGVLSVGVSCVVIGIIIGTVSLTSLGLNFGYLVLRIVGDGQLLLGGLMVMFMSIVLGMGVPGVAAYVIVAAVAVPVLVDVGASNMAAHMFCLIYACLSNITPPVAMSSYVASGIAKSNQTKTSLIAVKLGLTGFILPFFFLDNPILLLGQTDVSIWVTALAVITASLGVIALSAGLQGMFLKKCTLLDRLLLMAAAVLAIDTTMSTDFIAMGLFLVVVILQKVRKPKKTTPTPA
ncbi:MAG: TRAP transporter fused permease subunit [Eubacteriales bacterium]